MCLLNAILQRMLSVPWSLQSWRSTRVDPFSWCIFHYKKLRKNCNEDLYYKNVELMLLNFETVSQQSCIAVISRKSSLRIVSCNVAFKILNRPFPTSKHLHFQNEATGKCETFLAKVSFISKRIKSNLIMTNQKLTNLSYILYGCNCCIFMSGGPFLPLQ